MRTLPSLALSLLLCSVGCVKGGSIDSLPITVSLPTTAQSVDGGGKLTFQVEVGNDFSVDGVTWTLTGLGTLTYPSTLGVSSAKYATYYNAPNDVAITTTATLTATSVADMSKSASVKITVYPTVVLTAIPAGTAVKAGSAFRLALPGSGGSGSLTYAVTAGQLPAGLQLSAAGTVSGTATAVGTYSITVQVEDKPQDTVLGSAVQTYVFVVA